jgi:hypothetical protein
VSSCYPKEAATAQACAGGGRKPIEWGLAEPSGRPARRSNYHLAAPVPQIAKTRGERLPDVGRDRAAEAQKSVVRAAEGSNPLRAMELGR